MATALWHYQGSLGESAVLAKLLKEGGELDSMEYKECVHRDSFKAKKEGVTTEKALVGQQRVCAPKGVKEQLHRSA